MSSLFSDSFPHCLFMNGERKSTGNPKIFVQIQRMDLNPPRHLSENGCSIVIITLISIIMTNDDHHRHHHDDDDDQHHIDEVMKPCYCTALQLLWEIRATSVSTPSAPYNTSSSSSSSSSLSPSTSSSSSLSLCHHQRHHSHLKHHHYHHLCHQQYFVLVSPSTLSGNDLK